jgi:hypothetical protein
VFTGDRATALHDAELRLVPGALVELRIGLVTVRATLVPRPAASVPRPGVDRRPIAYGALALVLHLTVLATAMTVAPFEQLRSPLALLLRPVHVHIPTEPPPEPPPPPPKESHERSRDSGATAQYRQEGGATPQYARTQAIAAARARGMLDGLGDLHAIIGSVNIAEALRDVGPLYNEEEANRGNFGNSQRFDPTGCPDCGSVATGDYETTASGPGAGDDYFPGQVTKRPADPAIAICKAKGCTATGGTDLDSIDQHVRRQFGALSACFRRYAKPAVRGEVLVSFEITDAGKVRHTHGQGLGRVAGCVAEATSHLAFPAAPATQVTLALSFAPT